MDVFYIYGGGIESIRYSMLTKRVNKLENKLWYFLRFFGTSVVIAILMKLLIILTTSLNIKTKP